jgi:3-keto-L-gulonate-6-phosphate decarboxylase
VPRELADVVAELEARVARLPRRRQCVVLEVGPPLVVDLGGTAVTALRLEQAYPSPAVGDVVQVLVDNGQLFVLGPVA